MALGKKLYITAASKTKPFLLLTGSTLSIRDSLQAKRIEAVLGHTYGEVRSGAVLKPIKLLLFHAVDSHEKYGPWTFNFFRWQRVANFTGE